MASNLIEWLNLGLRWFHLIAGIAWIGSSFYFVWLDSHLGVPKTHPKEKVEGELWMVHSGGFYLVEKKLIGPGQVPNDLHWFKYEALFTWISGIFLLGVAYYLGGGAYLLDPEVAKLGAGAAAGIGIATVILSWFVYDTLWKNVPLKSSGTPALIASFGLLAGVAYGLSQLLSGRAAFIHVGAMLGTIMVANVWIRILPAQQQMISATQRGEEPNFDLGKHAKRRSMHNSYVTLPVVFLMFSNHYPGTYGHPLNWLILLLIFVGGASIRHLMIGKGPATKYALVPMAAALVAAFIMTIPKNTPSKTSDATGVPAEAPGFQTVNAVIQSRCTSCHAQKPTDEVFTAPPNGVMLDTPERIRIQAGRIKLRAVVSKTMPLGNKTGMTDEERALLGRWIDAGARITD